MNTRNLIVAAVALAGALAAGTSQARDHVQWSVNIGLPVITLPAPPVFVARPVVQYQYPAHYPVSAPRYAAPVRWDADRDGIPNRYDRVYNPRWDRDGDGVPNRYDRHPNRPDNGWQNGGYGRDGRGYGR